MTYNGILYEYTTNASMFDTDNDGLADGEEVVAGQDFYITHANNSDTDDDGLNDGAETLFVPRPWQEQTNPKNNLCPHISWNIYLCWCRSTKSL